MNKPDGGPAFPVPGIGTPGKHFFHPPQGGMSIRDHFAAEVTRGMYACQDFMNEISKITGSKEDARDMISDLAYKQADAMIERRER